MANFDGHDDTLDSREIIERIEELGHEYEDVTAREMPESPTKADLIFALGDDGAEEYDALTALRDDADSLSDWNYGETLIHEDYFTDAMKELCEDVGYTPANLPEWIKNNIDWDGVADALRADYTDFEFRGATYWARS